MDLAAWSELQQAAGIGISAGAWVEEELVETVGERGESGADFGSVHAEDAVEAPKRIGGTPRGIFPATLKICPSENGPECGSGGGLEGPGSTQTNSAREVKPDDFQQRAIDKRVGVEMVMGVNEAAFESGSLKKFPLADDFVADQFSRM